MNISFESLEFYPIPSPRRNDFEAHLARKIIICSENVVGVNINTLHGTYRSVRSGIPYHYVLFQDGAISYCRPRYWQNDFTTDDDSFINNSILILMDGLLKDEWSDSQIESLAQLCMFISKQDGIMFPNIAQYPDIVCSGETFPTWTTFRNYLFDKFTQFDPTRVDGEVKSLDEAGFGDNIKISVPGDIIKTVHDLSIYTGVPENIIESMNPYIRNSLSMAHDLQLMTTTAASGAGTYSVTLNTTADTMGVYGSGTESAVLKYQNAKGLTVDGKAGTATFSALVADITVAYPTWTNPYESYHPSSTQKLGSTGNGVAWTQAALKKLGYSLIGTYLPNGTAIVTAAIVAGLSASNSSSSTVTSSAVASAENLPLVINALSLNATVYDAVYETPIVTVKGSSDQSYVVQSTLYGGEDRPSFYDSIKFPGYKRATLQMDWAVPGKKPIDGISSYTVKFLVSPSSFSEARSNVRQMNRTNGGWYISRGGRNPITMNISGYMLDIKNYLERHQFIWNYKRFIEDRKNSLFEYENYYKTKFVCEGRAYYGYIDSVQFSKSSERPFMYQYNISFVALDDRYIFQSSLALKESKKIVPSSKTTTIKSGTLSAIVYNALNT